MPTPDRYHRRTLYDPTPVTLLAPLPLGRTTARNRLVFGPHVTNLGDGRAFSDRHAAYYRRRALGGCGTIVIEEAAVHDSDWSYERSPLATLASPGWTAIADALHAEGALAVAALGHTGGQGSSAYSQRELWAPSRVPEVNSREVPKWMEPADIAAVVAGFAEAAAAAVAAGCDGVEINAGQHSLVRQFLSGLTNQRGDEWGHDRLRFARDVIAATRRAIGVGPVLGLRLSCDELAPWAGITPEQSPSIAAALAIGIDYVVVTRGSIYTIDKTRPDFHEPAMHNLELCRSVRAALPSTVAVVLQGSVVDAGAADAALADGVADLVEMTRAQLADPDLARKLVAGTPERVRPCLRCNQTCQVRDARNPIVTCVVEPTTGHETEDPRWDGRAAQPFDVLVVGGGVAGLEAARAAAQRGHRVRLAERSPRLGGVAELAGPGGPLVAWLVAECQRLGVDLTTGTAITSDDVSANDRGPCHRIIVATGGRPGTRSYEVVEESMVHDLLDEGVLDGSLGGTVALWDPIGGPIGVALAERLGARAVLVTPDQIAGNELSRTGDLAPANVRLQQQGVRIERRSILRSVRAGEIELEDRFSGARRTIAVDALVDCGFRLPDETLAAAAARGHHRLIGDAVAPRTLLEAVLEGRRAALALG